MTYPQQPGGWSDPASGASYVDPVTGQPAYPTSPGQPTYPTSPGQPTYPTSPGQPTYPTSPGPYPMGQGGYAPPPQPAYGGVYPGYGTPVMVPQQPTNGMAIASLVLSLCGLFTCGVTSLIGAILGHVSRRQIRERGEGGDGMALAGIVTGWIIFALAVIGVAAYVIFFIWLYNNSNRFPSTYPT